jgi:hypothetical protein
VSHPLNIDDLLAHIDRVRVQAGLAAIAVHDDDKISAIRRLQFAMSSMREAMDTAEEVLLPELEREIAW